MGNNATPLTIMSDFFEYPVMANETEGLQLFEHEHHGSGIV